VRKTYKLAIASAGITAAAITMATPAFAAFSVDTAYGNMNTLNGSASIDRNDLSVLVTINLDPGSVFATPSSPNLQICASTQPFTARAAGKNNCAAVPNGEFQSYDVAGGATTAMETYTLNGVFEGQPAYLQIQVTTVDGGVTNTTFACWQNPPGAQSFFGNCAVNNDGTQLPVSALGGIGAAFVGAGGLALRQRRRRRRSADAAS